MLVKKHSARRKFVVFKVLIYLGIMALLGVTIFQLTVIYINHRDANLKDFVQDGTEGLFEGVTLNSIFYQQAAIFSLNGVLLYTSIFFVISLMDNLSRHGGVAEEENTY